MTPDQTRILVTGATGMQGPPIIEALLTRGFALRALTRQEAPGLPEAVEIARGDMDDAASLAAAMQGLDHRAFTRWLSKRRRRASHWHAGGRKNGTEALGVAPMRMADWAATCPGTPSRGMSVPMGSGGTGCRVPKPRSVCGL
jgi:hypothetical protein